MNLLFRIARSRIIRKNIIILLPHPHLMALSIIDLIQASLAPLLLISAGGLLALTLQNRYGRIIDRIRVFDEEIRNCYPDCHEALKERRMKSIKEQTVELLRRGRYLRNSLTCVMASMFLSALTSIFISAQAIAGSFFTPIIFSVFSGALISLLIGVSYAVKEVLLSYDAIQMEIEMEGVMMED